MDALNWYLVGGVVCSVCMLTLYGVGIVINKLIDFVLEIFK